MKTLILFWSFILFTYGLYSQNPDTIKTWQWEQKATELYETFKFDSSAHCYFQAAEIYEQKENWINSVKNYRLMAESLNQSTKFDSALYSIQKALDIANNYFLENIKNEAFEKAETFIVLGEIQENLGNYKKELLCYEKALDIVLQADSLASLKVAQIWNSIGGAYCHIEQYDKALEFCEKSLEVNQKLLKNNHIDLAKPLSNLGMIYYFLSDFDRALEYYQQSLNIKTQTFGEFHPEAIKCYLNIGELYRNKGVYDKALEYSSKAIQICTQTFGENHPDVATGYQIIGNININFKGDYNKAYEYYQKALKIKINAYKENHPKVASIYKNIGVIYFKKGDHDKALEYYQKALKILIQTNGENQTTVATCYNNMAIIHRYKKNLDKTIEYSQKALKINLHIYGEYHPTIADSYTILGIAYYFMKDYDKTLEYYEKALKIYILTHGEQHHSAAMIYNNIGLIYSRKGDYIKALECFQKTLKIRKHIYGEHHPYLADSYIKMTIVSNAKKDFKQTIEYYHKALMANLSDFNDSNIYHNPNQLNALSDPNLLRTLIGKARAFYMLYKESDHSINDLYASMSTYNVGLNHFHEIQTDYSNENTQLYFSEDAKFIFEEAIQVTIELNKRDATKENREKAFEFMEKSKSATLSAYLNNMELKQNSNIADSLLEKEKDIAINRRKYETKIQQAKSQKEGYDTLLVHNYQDKLFDYSRQYDNLMNAMEHNYPDYFTLKYKQGIAQTEDIQTQLNENSALINYFVGDTSLFICVISKDRYAIETVKTDSLFNEKIIDYYIDIKSNFTEKELKYSSYLYNYLIEPIEEYIQNKSNLIIIPDGNLYYVPFETLCKNDTYTEDLSALNYLIKNYSVTYHHTATLWLNSRKKASNQLTTQDNFIGFAPVFDPKVNNGFIVSSEWISDTTDMELATRSISRDFTYLNPLEYSEDEVKSIVKLFNKQKKEAKGFFYKEANEENFKHYTQNYKYIHIASHSFTNDLYPSLSGIAFSQPDTSITNKEHGEDGILYAGETYNLNLPQANLIVLSSCKSGLGKLIQGEGFLSLSRGFLYSGAPNIMFSLWNVKDEQTKYLMIHFYKHILQGTDYASALREAKIQLINNPKTALPKYWGAWMLIGR